MEDDKSRDIQTYPWEHIPKDIYLYVIFPRLSLDKLEALEKMSDFFASLVSRYRGELSVISPTPSDHENYFTEEYQYTKIDAAHKAFLTALFATPKTVSPDEIVLDHYRPLGVNETDVFNTLLFLFRQGNRGLLARIYAFALMYYQSSESFGFHTDAPITDYLTTPQQVENFVRAQWAICTYQSSQEFDKHFAAMGALTERQKYAVHEKLLQYACNTENQAMVNHLCLHPRYELFGELCELDNTFGVVRALEQGLNINAAFLMACKQDYFNIEIIILLFQHGANPLAALKQKSYIDASNIKRALPYMLWQYNKENPDAQKSREDLQTAIMNPDAHQTESTFDQMATLGRRYI